MPLVDKGRKICGFEEGTFYVEDLVEVQVGGLTVGMDGQWREQSWKDTRGVGRSERDKEESRDKPRTGTSIVLIILNCIPPTPPSSRISQPWHSLGVWEPLTAAQRRK